MVVGGGLAGCEAAWQLARRGVPVRLFEMRPVRSSPAHGTDALAELVCSNSLRSDAPENAVGLLHEELRRAGSLVLGRGRREPRAGGLGARGRSRSPSRARISERIEAEPAIELVRGEVTELPRGSRDPRHRAAHQRRARGAGSSAVRRLTLLLRLDRAGGVRRQSRPGRDLPRLALGRSRGGRRRLPERPALARGVPPVRVGAGARPRSCRCTRSRSRSTSRAACRSR